MGESKPCQLCSFEVVSDDGKVRHSRYNERQFNCAPSPCPICWERAALVWRKAGQKLAKKREDECIDFVERWCNSLTIDRGNS